MSSARLSSQFLVILEFVQRMGVRTTGITKQIKTRRIFCVLWRRTMSWLTRQCYGSTPRDCQVSSWSPWSFCSAAQCGQQGSQSKSREEQSSSACGGAECPKLHETRQCYATTRVDCQLSSWSEWSACTVPCGVSGTQHSARHRIVTEQCGGTCTSTFRKTRACPDLSCMNGGSLKDGLCFCEEGYSGNCCEKKGRGKRTQNLLKTGELAGQSNT